MKVWRLVGVGIVAGMVAGCAHGAPPGFSKGDRWAFPLIAPLEDGLLVTPVKVNGKGPYLFVIDPDSPDSVVDAHVQRACDLYSLMAGEALNEADFLVNTVVGETRTIQIADLTVSNHAVIVIASGQLSFGGRPVHGIIGRDVVSEAMTLSVDRQRGMAYLATKGHVPPPAGAQAVRGRRLFRRLAVGGTLNRHTSIMVAVDVGTPISQLWPSVMAKARLPHTAVDETLVDELGTVREVSGGGLAAKLAIGGVEGDAVLVVPFGDKRRREQDYDGVVGQNFLSEFDYTIDYDASTVWLAPRKDDLEATADERIRRWGPRLSGCASRGCATVQLAAGGSLEIRREPVAAALAYEILVDAVGGDGRSLGLPKLRVTLREGLDTVVEPIGPEYAGAAGFHVLDVNPLPAPCMQAGDSVRCAWTITPPR